MLTVLKSELSSPLSDPKWLRKTIVGALLQGLGVTAPILVGYKLRLIRESANGESRELPKFNNLGQLWLEGMKMTLVILAAFLLCVGAILGVGMALTLTLLEVGFQFDPYVAGQILGGVAAAAPFLFLWYLLPALTLAYAKSGRVSSLLDPRAAFTYIRRAPSTYNLFSILSIVGLSALGCSAGVLLGEWSSQVVYMLVATWILFVQGRFLGAYYRRYLV
jgi:Protein of unknown function (DUF4013)